jgi:hypothetical protein
VTRLLTRLYPREWRERYGDELSELIDETGLSPRVALDVARGASREWTSQARLAVAGGTSMVIGPAWRHPQMWALVALIVIAPTTLFVVLSMLAYQFGISGLVGLMEPVNQWLNGQRLLDLLLVVSPAAGRLLAAAPLLKLDLHKRDSGGSATIELRMKALNLVVALLALLIGGLLVGHIVFENVLQVGA